MISSKGDRVAASERVLFTDRDVSRQSIANATSLPYLLVAYGLQSGWSAPRTAVFCGDLLSKGWERLRGTGARAIVRQFALNLMCSGGEARFLSGGSDHAESWVADVLDRYEVDRFGISRPQAQQFTTAFSPIANSLGYRFTWRKAGNDIVLKLDVAGRKARASHQVERERDPGGVKFTTAEIHQHALANSSSLPYLMVALARATDRTPDDVVAFAAKGLLPFWEPLRYSGAAAIACQMAVNVVACGGELEHFRGGRRNAEAHLSGLPTEEEAAFFDVPLSDVDQCYEMFALIAAHLGYLATWRRVGNEVVLTVYKPR